MDIVDNLDDLLDIEREQDEQIEMEENNPYDDIEQYQENHNEDSIQKDIPLDPEIIDILNETVEINEEEEKAQQDLEMEEEEEKQYLFTIPPDGQSAVCKLEDGSMVFLKRSTYWKDQIVKEKKTHLLSKPIEDLIDEVRENRIRKELIQKEIEETSSTRNAQVNWEQTFKPQSFIHLLSDEYCNRIFMKWLSQWKPMLFHTHENIDTSAIDSLPFFCPTCGKGGFHKKNCTNKIPLRPYYAPDLPSPLPTRPANPLFILYGPTGCGKTTLVQIAASTHHFHLISFAGEMMGVSLEQTLVELKSLFETKELFDSKQPPLLFFDNFDTSFSIHERKAIVNFLGKKYKEIGNDSSKRLIPVVICCNDIYSSSLYELKSFYRQVKLPPIASTQQVQFLERICTKLQIPYEVSGLTALVASGEGDLRFVLNSLHSIVFSDGEVTLKSVKKDVMNKKDVIQSIDDYFNLIFICSRAQGKRKARVSNLPQIFTHIYDINQDFLIDGILETIPTIPLPDPALNRYIHGLEALMMFDSIQYQVKKTKNYSLVSLLPIYIGIIHSLYVREKPASIKHISTKTGYTMHQRRLHYQEELTIIQESKALRSCEGLRHTPLVLEYLSPLLSCITPTIRPVDSLLLTTKEKRELAHITELMIDYGCSYETSQSTGSLTIALKPALDQIAVFPGIEHPFSTVRSTVKFKIHAELQRYSLNIASKMTQSDKKNMDTKIYQTDKKNVEKTTQVETTQHLTPKKRHTPLIMESPQKKLQMDVKCVENEMTPIKKTTFFTTQHTSRTRKTVTGVVFRYQQGFTCAVRQPSSIHDFL